MTYHKNALILSQIFSMPQKVTPYKDSSLNKKQQVEQMFDTISGKYDDLNRLISFGLDVKWRKKVIKIVIDTKPKSILDIATGTGDLALKLCGSGASEIIGLDISEGMLKQAQKKAAVQNLTDKLSFVQGDSEVLPFSDATFDAITVAFGVRNFENLEKGLSEIYRVLKPKGVFVVLETSVPLKTPYKQGYKLYTNYVLPLIGKLFSKDKVAYAYLSESASVFPHGQAFNNILQKIGFINVENEPQTFGVASIYTASK